ncbi:hypothetical protein DER45DRAFT_566301 [Fusarium avenaceum]|nr:hypothetical protein DER45DRAFT_566301 [Fusarium avenaceum]
MAPPPSDATFLYDRSAVARHFIILFILNLVSLAVSFGVFFAHACEEEDELAQCILGSIASVALFACIFLIRSIKLDTPGQKRLTFCVLADATWTMTSGIFGIVTGIQKFMGTEPETYVIVSTINMILLILNCVFGIFLGSGLKRLQDALKRPNSTSSAADPGDTEQEQGMAQLGVRPTNLQTTASNGE